MNRIALSFIVIASILSCKDKEPQPKLPIFEVMANMQKVKLSNLVDSIQYLPLETNDSSLIGNISRIVATPHQIFVGDRLANSVFVFNKQGKFLHKICRQGRGPEEYIRLYDFDVNEQDSSIYFYCGTHIQIYDYNGNYKQTVPIDSSLFPTTMAVSNHCIYLSMNYNTCLEDQPYNSIFIDSKGNIIEKSSPYPKEIAGQINYSPRLFFRFRHDTLLYFNNFEYIIHEYIQGHSTPKFKLNFNEHEVPPIHSQNIENLQRTHFQNYALLYNIAYIKGKYYILFLMNDMKYLSVIYPQKGIIRTVNISTDLEYDNSLTPHFLDFNCIENNSFVTYYEWSDAPELFSKLKLSADHNPIIVFYHIK